MEKQTAAAKWPPLWFHKGYELGGISLASIS